MVWLAAVVILCNCFCGAASAQVVGAQGRLIDNYLERLSGFGYSGTVLVAVDGKVILRKGYGFADREKRIANRPGTLFDMGSLAKNFTAAAILRLETDGKLRVEDPISKFLQDVPEDKRSITVHQLLTHTAGVTGPEHGYQVISKKDAIHGILATPLQFQPGSKWAYSNAGFVLLAAVIESASGESYQEYMIRNIFVRQDCPPLVFGGRDYRISLLAGLPKATTNWRWWRTLRNFLEIRGTTWEAGRLFLRSTTCTDGSRVWNTIESCRAPS